jgi:hypothetical protein
MKNVSIGLNLTAGVETVVYTVPTGYTAKWNLMYLFNGTGSTKHITVVWREADLATDIYILNQTSVSSKDYFRLDGGAYVVLEEGDTIKITPEAGSTFSTICTFELERKTYAN